MRRKRLEKYALTALALVIVVCAAVGFKLEDRNAKLPDGQGEIVVNTDQTGENAGRAGRLRRCGRRGAGWRQ